MNINVLDHGYVKLIESWGSDERIIESARMSTDGGFVSWESYEGHPKGDLGLLSYLWKHKHLTPFEMCGMTIEVQAPIFVFREWHRHRTQSYNELSARYTALPDLFYVPSYERIRTAGQGKVNKQGSEGLVNDVHLVQDTFIESFKAARADYEWLLRQGVAKELARLVIPVAQYSRMRASANLRNWLAFLTLRLPPNAQWEIRQFAEATETILMNLFPKTWSLFHQDQPQQP